MTSRTLVKCSSRPNPESKALCHLPIGFLLVLVCVAPLRAARADTGEAAWLRYARLQPSIAAQYKSLPKEVLVLGDSPMLISARNEMIRGVDGMLGEKLRIVHRRDIHRSAIVLGTIAQMSALFPDVVSPSNLSEDSFWIARMKSATSNSIIIAGATTVGFSTARSRCCAKSRDGEPSRQLSTKSSALRAASLGQSMGQSRRHHRARLRRPLDLLRQRRTSAHDLSRVGEYARLLASVGINGCTINNVNADPQLLAPEIRSRSLRASPTPSAPGVCSCRSQSISAARKQSAASTPSIRSIRKSLRGGAQKSTRSTR